ncbi:hypothetical protein KA005_37825, partial [bacterium]|nr:hypothetical protein [bacterium]
MIKQQVDSNFKVVLFVLIVNFYINTYLLFILGSIHIRGIGLPGYFRFAISGVVGILFLGQLKKYSYVLAQQRGLCVAIFLFFLILAIQFFIVDDKVLHLQGSVKYFFYFTCLLLSLYSCYYDSKNARNALVIVAIILFASVIFFYPYIICKAGMNPYERLTVYMRSSFLLRAGNEDAHFMLTLFPFLLAKFHGKKFLTIVFLVFCFLALIYNGTRSTLVMAPIVTLLYYNIISKRKLLLGGLLTALIVAGMSALPQILALMFEKEMGLILNYQDFLYGNYVGGNLSRRVSFIWLPTIKDTIQNSFWVGYGSNGWSLVAGKVAMMGFMNGKYVASS